LARHEDRQASFRVEVDAERGSGHKPGDGFTLQSSFGREEGAGYGEGGPWATGVAFHERNGPLCGEDGHLGRWSHNPMAPWNRVAVKSIPALFQRGLIFI
jgi:hypothetical protein